jgi:hypothetical protein
MAPSTPTVTFGLTQQFTATVNGTNNPSQAVTWKATYGTITSAGLYTAPASGTTDTVTATSVENTAISGNADVTLTDSTVTSVTVSPGTPTVTVGNTQQFTAAVNGTNNPNQAVTWTATYGTITPGGLYTAPATGTNDTVTATSVQKNTISGTATVTLPSTVTSVTVAPSTPTMTFGNTQQFTATVNGTNNPSQAVTWKATYGTITSAGLYTAPASGTTDTVTATSVQNSAISGTAAVTLTTATMTVTGTIMVNYQPYNAGTQTITPDPLPRSNVLSVEAIVTGSSYPGTYNVTTGGFSIPNVPVGYYTLVMTATTRTFTFYSNQPNIVLDYDQQGRSTVQYPTTSSTDVIFNTGGMTAWTANDYSYLTFFDPNAYLYCEPDSICYTGYPVVGATALSGLGVNWYNNGLPLVDTTQGDAPILEQMVDTTPAGPSHLVTGQNLYYPTPLTILNSSGATIGGSFSPETQSGSVTVIYERSGFAAYRSDFNTGATHRSPHFEVDDSPGAGTYYQTDSNSMDRLWFLDHTSTGDVNLGSVPMPPILPGFDRVYNAGQHSYMVYQLPGNSANQTTWHSIYALSQTAPTSGSPIVPVVSHPRNLMIGSTSMLSGAGILATGVGTTPTFTWQAPALGTPQGYKVDVYQVQASGGQTHVSGSILRMFTTATQVQCPSNVLLSGNFYIFEVTAFADSSYAPLTAPFHVMKLPCAYARNVSGIFAPSADPIVTSVTVSPSTQSVTYGLTQQFTATVNGMNNPSQAVTWTATYGTITSGGLYTAPAAGANDTVTAASVQNTAISGTAAVTLTAPTSTVTSVTVSPSTLSVTFGNTQQFTATVNGTNGPSQAVTWTAIYGTITSAGLYTAPASGTTDTVTARSVQNASYSGTATVTLGSLPAISSFTANPTTLTAGGAAQLTGIFSNGTGVITPGNLAATSGIAVTVTPTATTIYSLTVTNDAGTVVTQNAGITVLPLTYQLTVIVDGSVQGSPSAAVQAIANNTSVPYSYTPGAGMASAMVEIDGTIVPAAGTLTMNQNHVLWAFGQPVSGTSYPGMMTIPSDVTQIPYPQFYTSQTGFNFTVPDPYCTVASTVVAYPSSYLGMYPLPAIQGAPLATGILRGVSDKDCYWSNNPAYSVTCNGCSGTDNHQAFLDMLARNKNLGADYVTVSQGVRLNDTNAPTLSFDLTTLSLSDADLTWMVAQANALGMGVHVDMEVSGDEAGLAPPTNPTNEYVTNYLNAWSTYVVNRAQMAQQQGVAAMEIDWMMWSFQCWGSQFWPAYVQSMTDLAQQIRSVYQGKIYMAWQGTMDMIPTNIDWMRVCLNHNLTSTQIANLSVALRKHTYIDQINSLASSMGKNVIPVVWIFDIESYQDFFLNGWVEDGLCVNNCMQNSLTTDFSEQAIGYEGFLEAITNQTSVPTAAVESYSYWWVDVILPDQSFPNISCSVRNKPAESIIYQWYKR